MKTIRNINATNKRTTEDSFKVFRGKYVKLESRATDKHKWRKLTFEPNTKSLSDFLEELDEMSRQNEHFVIKPNKRSPVSYSPKCFRIWKDQLIRDTSKKVRTTR